MTEETKATKPPISKNPKLTKDIDGFTKGTPVEFIKTYEETGHHRIRVHMGDGEVSNDMVVGPDDIA